MDVEYVCALLLEKVEKTLYSIRMLIEEEFANKAPRGLLHALCLGVLRNYKLLEASLRYCGYRGRLRGSRRGWLPLVVAYEAIFRRNYISRLRLEKFEPVLGENVVKCLYNLDVEYVLSQYTGLEKLSIKYSIAKWVIEKLSEVNPPGGVEALLEAFNKPQPQWIRFNSSRLTRHEAIRILEGLGISVEPDPILDDMLMIKSVKPQSLSRIDRSLFYIQDRSAALVAHVLGDPGALCGDFFSAPGGKASHVSWRYNGIVVSIEVSERRLSVEKSLLSSMKAWSVILVEANAFHPPLRESLTAVIVDPDCSSMGRLGHSPETRLFLEKAGPKIIEKMARLQLRGLKAAISVARKGSVIVYSTCTLTREENEDIVRKILDEGLAELEEASPWIGSRSPFIPPAQRLYPHISLSSGGFVAKLRKI